MAKLRMRTNYQLQHQRLGLCLLTQRTQLEFPPSGFGSSEFDAKLAAMFARATNKHSSALSQVFMARCWVSGPRVCVPCLSAVLLQKCHKELTKYGRQTLPKPPSRVLLPSTVGQPGVIWGFHRWSMRSQCILPRRTPASGGIVQSPIQDMYFHFVSDNEGLQCHCAGCSALQTMAILQVYQAKA